MDPWHPMPWYGMIFGPLMMVLVLAGVIVAVVLVLRWLGGDFPHAHSGRSRPGGRRPLEILEERYARGEIDKEEFEERRRTLEG